MIDPTTSKIQSSALKQTNNRQKVEQEKKNEVSPESPRTTEVKQEDQLQLTTAQTERQERRQPENPIGSDDEAGEIISFTSNQLALDANLAEKAQANLNPDKVLELIA